MRGNFWARTSLNVSVTYPLVWRGISPVTIFLALHSALMFACRYIPRTSVLIHIHVHVYIKQLVAIWREKNICPRTLSVPRSETVFPRAKLEENCELRGTDNVQDKYPSIFSPQMGDYCLHYPSNRFGNARNFKIGEYSPVLAGEYSVTWRA